MVSLAARFLFFSMLLPVSQAFATEEPERVVVIGERLKIPVEPITEPIQISPFDGIAPAGGSGRAGSTDPKDDKKTTEERKGENEKSQNKFLDWLKKFIGGTRDKIAEKWDKVLERITFGGRSKGKIVIKGTINEDGTSDITIEEDYDNCWGVGPEAVKNCAEMRIIRFRDGSYMLKIMPLYQAELEGNATLINFEEETMRFYFSAETGDHANLMISLATGRHPEIEPPCSDTIGHSQYFDQGPIRNFPNGSIRFACQYGQFVEEKRNCFDGYGLESKSCKPLACGDLAHGERDFLYETQCVGGSKQMTFDLCNFGQLVDEVEEIECEVGGGTLPPIDITPF